MEVICLETQAFYALIDNVVKHIDEKHAAKEEKWVSTDEAMSLLKITSKTTLQKYRDEGKIRYSQSGKKNIVYDRDSLIAFHEKNAKEPF